jgi:hypothetical protein
VVSVLKKLVRGTRTKAAEMDLITEWELRKVLDNSNLSSITEFKRMGVNVPESSVRTLVEPKTQ